MFSSRYRLGINNSIKQDGLKTELKLSCPYQGEKTYIDHSTQGNVFALPLGLNNLALYSPFICLSFMPFHPRLPISSTMADVNN